MVGGRDGGSVVGNQGKACGFRSGKKKKILTEERWGGGQWFNMNLTCSGSCQLPDIRKTDQWAFQKDKYC